MLLSWVGSYGRIKKKMTIGKNTDVQKAGIKELQRLTLINILKSKGVIYRHYQLKFQQKKHQSSQTYLPMIPLSIDQS
jgi:hypothetical protein